jgi:hypothetical protein
MPSPEAGRKYTSRTRPVCGQTDPGFLLLVRVAGNRFLVHTQAVLPVADPTG